MASLMFTVILGIISILGSLFTAYLTYGIYRYNRLSKGWLALTWAFIFIVLRRTLGFVSDFKLLPDYLPIFKTTEGFLLLLITFLNIIGLYTMLKNFEEFDIVEKKTKKLIKSRDKK